MEEIKKKKTMGRRKIEIKKIEKKSSLQVTFTKRRMGLFRKASELSVLCGSEIAILVQSPAQKIFAFGHPSVDALVNRFHGANSHEFAVASSLMRYLDDGGRGKYEEAVRKLAVEKRSGTGDSTAARDRFWWNEAIEGMELHELEDYVEAMEALKDKLHELEKRKLAEAAALEVDVVNVDHSIGGGLTASFDYQFDDDQDFDLDWSKWLGWS